MGSLSPPIHLYSFLSCTRFFAKTVLSLEFSAEQEGWELGTAHLQNTPGDSCAEVDGAAPGWVQTGKVLGARGAVAAVAEVPLPQPSSIAPRQPGQWDEFFL